MEGRRDDMEVGTWNLPAAAKNYSPVETTACYGLGPYCPPGRHRVCGPYRCWCARC